MPKIKYQHKNLKRATRDLIDLANSVIEQYTKEGYVLTLRQLYYQFVSHSWIANSNRAYKQLGEAVNVGRLTGRIDWDAIVDHTRRIRKKPHWENPADIIKDAARQYAIDKWANQPWRCEVWTEKEALVGVFEPVCEELDVPLFCCRGYTGQSSMWAGALRLGEYVQFGQSVKVLYFGDHDPSGLDMTRDVRDRIRLFTDMGIPVERVALTLEQVKQYNLPPNPAKLTDKRAAQYVAEFGSKSWELDALPPDALRDLVEKAVLSIRVEKLWKKQVNKEKRQRKGLKQASDHWTMVEKFLAL